MAASILFADDRVSKKLFLLLEKEGQVDEENEEGAEGKKPDNPKTVLQAMLFTIDRITLLQKLVSFPPEQVLLKPLRLGCV
jgi:hypothetical protein